MPTTASTVDTRDELLPELLRLYPGLASISQTERDAILAAHARWLDAPAAAVLFDEGAPCRGFPLVVAGEVRVARGSAGGRSLDLYHVAPGEVCVVSTSCLFAVRPLLARGTTTQPTRLLLLDPAGFEACCAHAPFRRFVFDIFGERLADLMELVEAVAFQRLDQRLAAALLGRGPAIAVTHQALADELGTAREIVSRLLRRFERAGWLRLARERIELLDAAALRDCAADKA